MITRLKSKNLQSDDRKKPYDNQKKPVRLTEDLLYMVNKKLMKTDSLLRLQETKRFFSRKFFPNWETTEPHVFKEITYRKKPREYLSEESIAVMHEAYFYSSSIANPTDDTMDDF